MRFTVSRLAQELGVSYQGHGEREITGVKTLETAGPEDLSFLANPKYAEQVKATRAGAVLLSKEYADHAETVLISEQPYLDFARAVKLFAKEQGSFQGQSDLAYIHPGAKVAGDVTVYPFVFIGAEAVVESGTVLFSGVYVGEDSRIGKNCILYPNCVLMADTRLGDEVIVHPGVVLGSDGFGFAQADFGLEKFPQVGNTIVEDSVEIGANTTIDRAALGETRIGKGTKIDNLVQIAHNVSIGEHCVLVSQVGISGSTKIGKNVILAGQVGIAGHIEIGDGCRVGAKSGINKSLPPGKDVSGAPAIDHVQFLKVASLQAKLPDMRKKLLRMEKELEKLKNVVLDGGEHDAES